MKKRLHAFIFCILVLFLLTISFTLAVENDTANTEQSQIEKAYSCLEGKVEGKCSSLSIEEQIFSSLALSHISDIASECKDAILADSKNNECWPKSGCKIKTTAQAILALEQLGQDTKKAEAWLLSQKDIPRDLVWYLEIESNEETTCKISYGSTYTITISSDKKISSGAGGCLSLSENGYWLKVSSNCYDKEFSISCDKSFLTTLLYTKTGSSTIHVSETTNSASADGTTTEKINSACFKQGNSCDYEGSLWATLILDAIGQDVDPFVPYLLVMADESVNEKYLPDAFLYLITNYQDFYVDLLLQQKADYWDESKDKYYDTAVALFALQNEEPIEKTNAMNWLLEVQDKDGCWGGNIRNTAFILYAAWPKSAEEIPTIVEDDCEPDNGYCMSSIKCQDAGGLELHYFCSGTFVCCDKQEAEKTCVEKGGIICNANEICSGIGDTASDLQISQTCCIQGICQESVAPVTNECEGTYGGTCRASGCYEDEEEKSYTCEYYTDACCFKKTTNGGGSYWWIWLLIILIILVIIAIIFREKLRYVWFRVKSKFKRKPKGWPSPMMGPRPGFPPGPPGMLRRPMPRGILPPGARRPMMRPTPKPKTTSDFDEVLKKLKEMGK